MATLSRLAARRPAARHVLDVATGTAAVALELARQKDCYVVGVDQSAEMLETGAQHVRHAGATASRLERADARRCRSKTAPSTGSRLPTSSLRRGSSRNAEELARVVRPGGVIAGLEFRVPRGVWRSPWELWVRVGLPGPDD